jgi:hypothetical protein
LAGWLTGAVFRSTESPPRQNHPAQEKRSPISTLNLSSTKSLSSFTTNTGLVSTGDLALWLLDASPIEIAELWEHHSQQKDLETTTAELILAAWARHDPMAAVAATKDSRLEELAWQGFAIHHPERALQQALTNDEASSASPLSMASLSLARFHSSWLQNNLDLFPEEWMKRDALLNFQPDLTQSTPQEAIEFMRNNDLQISSDLILALAIEDPLEANRLALDNRQQGPWGDPKIIGKMIQHLADEAPDQLALLHSATKSLQIRSSIELHQFKAEIQNDPVGALEKLKDLPMSFSKQDQMAELGEHHLENNPDLALEIFAELVNQSKGPLDRSLKIHTENTTMWHGESSENLPVQLREKLLTTQPEALMDLITNKGELAAAATRWAEIDKSQFAEWANRQQDPENVSISANTLTNRYLNDGQVPQAMEWAQKIPTPGDSLPYQIFNIYDHWQLQDPAAARAWRSSQNFSTDHAARLDQIEAKYQ